jgi:hypothetical protein
MASPAPSEGERPTDEQSETAAAPHRDSDPPTGSRVQQSAWLVALALMLVLFLGFMVAWGVGVLGSGS